MEQTNESAPRVQGKSTAQAILTLCQTVQALKMDDTSLRNYLTVWLAEHPVIGHADELLEHLAARYGKAWGYKSIEEDQALIRLCIPYVPNDAKEA